MAADRDVTQAGLDDFWQVYDHRYVDMAVASLTAMREHPEMRAVFAEMSEEGIVAYARASHQAIARAIHGDWDVYERLLRERGASYARRGVAMSAWIDAVASYYRQFVPTLVEAYGHDPPRLTGALLGMHRFVDQVMARLVDGYAEEHAAQVQRHRMDAADRARKLAETEARNRTLEEREQYRIQAELFRLFVEAVQDYELIMLDPAGRIMSWSAGAERIKGYRAEEIIGQHFSCFYTPEDVAAGKPARELAAAARDGRFETEGWRLRRDGRRFWANVVVTAVRDEAGVLRGFGKVTRDCTEPRFAAEQLANANRFLDSVIESVPAMIFVKEAAELRFARFNRAGEQLLGWDRSQLIGKRDHDLFPKEQADFFTAKDREVLERREQVTIQEEQIQTRRGERTLHTSKVPILDEKGRARYLLGISLDVTEMKEAREQLQQAYEEVETLNRRLGEQNAELQRTSHAKSDFLAMMSHELRTPLNSIIGFSEVLLDEKFGALNERQSRYVRNVNDSGRHLLGLINELLDLSKIEAGRLEVSLDSCSARNVAADAIATVQPLAHAGGIDLALEPGPGAPTVTADAARLKQALYNLLSNAIKFTPRGGRVRVTVGPAPSDDLVRLTVRDEGPGIAPTDQARLFQEFTQLAAAKGRGGTGLGLALTRRLVGLMGGRVGVDSRPGHGSAFHIDLPPGVAADDPDPPELDGGRGPLVLVVEDDPAAQELFRLMLSDNGYRARIVSTAEQGLAEARRLHPDAITIDVFLPTIDGWDLLRLLKADPDTASIPAIVVSISSDRAKAFSLGALEHLVKPVERDALLAALERRNLGRPDSQPPLHVLAVDDDPRQRELLRALLEPRGFRVSTEATGRDGLAAARRGPVDVLLLDLVLPDLSGVEVVWELRADERTRELPILLVTAHDLSPSDRERLHGDVQAIVTKSSTNADALLSEIARVLPVRR